MNIVALIPARGGSKRVPQKNIRPLAYQPLIAYTIQAALKSGIFDKIVVSTDCEMTKKISYAYGADVVIDRPEEISGDLSHDFEWVSHALSLLPPSDCFAILRPTSPFRTAETILRAWELFKGSQPCDSLRAVQKVKEHPAKVWGYDTSELKHIIPYDPHFIEIDDCEFPGFDMPYQRLPEAFIQNGCLQIAHTSVLREHGNVTGSAVTPFFTEGYEGLDINTREDIWLAESIINGHIASPADIMLGYREGGKDKGISHQELMDMLRRAGFDA